MRIYKLGDLIKIKHGFSFKSRFFSDEGDYVVLKPGNFNENGGLNFEGKGITYYTSDFDKEYLLKKGDFLVVMTDLKQDAPILGSPAFIPESDVYLHNQRLGLINTLYPKTLDKSYLYYLFNTRQVREQIRASASGATVKHTSPERIYNIEVALPNIETQKSIASKLSAFDNLIKNNNRRIEILEEMAMLIYREWFVHLRYPGHEQDEFVDSELGQIPSKWDIKSFQDIAYFQNGKAFKPEQWGNKGIPIIKIKELKEGINQETPFYNGTVEEKFHINDGDLLFAWSASLGIFMWYKGHAYLNQHIFKVQPKYDYLTNNYLYYALNFSLPRFQNKTQGTTMQHIRKSALREVKVPLPSKDVIDKFNGIVKPIRDQVLVLSKQNEHLKETRDTLLPKLVKGQIDIKNNAMSA